MRFEPLRTASSGRPLLLGAPTSRFYRELTITGLPTGSSGSLMLTKNIVKFGVNWLFNGYGKKPR